MKTFYEKKIDYINKRYKNDKRKKRFIKQYTKNGWCDIDSWSVGNSIAIYSLPIIVQFRNNLMSYPMGLSIKEWRGILDEIIWFLAECSYHTDRERLLDFKYSSPKFPKFKDYKIKYTWALSKKKFDKEEDMKVYCERLVKANNLFGEYFLDLWD